MVIIVLEGDVWAIKSVRIIRSDRIIVVIEFCVVNISKMFYIREKLPYLYLQLYIR